MPIFTPLCERNSWTIHFAKAGLCYYNDREVVKKNIGFQRGQSINSFEDGIKIIYGAGENGAIGNVSRTKQTRSCPLPRWEGCGEGDIFTNSLSAPQPV